jgi:hypothetical protein
LCWPCVVGLIGIVTLYTPSGYLVSLVTVGGVCVMLGEPIVVDAMTGLIMYEKKV